MRATIILVLVLTAALSGCASTGAEESETTMTSATKQQKMSCRREKNYKLSSPWREGLQTDS